MPLPAAIPIAMAAAGAIAGMIGKGQESAAAQAGIAHNAQNAWQKYLIEKEYGDKLFDLNRANALGNLDVSKTKLDRQLGVNIDEFNLGLLGQAYNIQDARAGLAGQLGMSLAAEGASGTRGNDANTMIRAYAQTSFDRNVDFQYKQNDLTLAGILGGANEANRDITRERAKWGPDGYYILQKEYQDALNLQNARLGQDNFNWQLSNAAATPMDYLAGMLGGAAAGARFGQQVSGYFDQLGSANPQAGYSLGGNSYAASGYSNQWAAGWRSR